MPPITADLVKPVRLLYFIINAFYVGKSGYNLTFPLLGCCSLMSANHLNGFSLNLHDLKNTAYNQTQNNLHQLLPLMHLYVVDFWIEHKVNSHP